MCQFTTFLCERFVELKLETIVLLIALATWTSKYQTQTSTAWNTSYIFADKHAVNLRLL